MDWARSDHMDQIMDISRMALKVEMVGGALSGTTGHFQRILHRNDFAEAIQSLITRLRAGTLKVSLSKQGSPC